MIMPTPSKKLSDRDERPGKDEVDFSLAEALEPLAFRKAVGKLLKDKATSSSPLTKGSTSSKTKDAT
jgi:hypothetical protein